jgi:MFS family permease
VGTDVVKSRLPFLVRGFAAVSALNDTASEMVYPLLPAVVVGTLGGNAAMLGTLDGASALADALTRLVASRFADRPHRNRLVFGGYAVAAAARPVMGLVGAGGLVIGLRVADRVGKGSRSPARDAMIAQAVPADHRGRAFGFQRAWDHAGAMFGGLLGWVLLQFFHLVPRHVLLWSAVPGLAMLTMLAVTLRRAPAPAVRRAPPPPAADGAIDARDHPPLSHFWLPVLALALVLASRLPETLLLLHLQRRGIAIALIPLLWSALHVVRSSVAYPAGRVVDRLGERWTVAAAALLAVVGAVAFAYAASRWWLIASFLVVGAVAAVSEPAERTLVARLAPRGFGRAYGKAQGVIGLAALAAGLGFGVLVDRIDTRVALLVSAAASSVAMVLWVAIGAGGRRLAGVT